MKFYLTNLSPKPVEKKLSYKAALYYLPEHIKWQIPLELRKQLTLWLQDVFYSKDEFLDKWTQPGTCFDNLPILRKKITCYLSLYKLLCICYNWFVLTHKLFSMCMKKKFIVIISPRFTKIWVLVIPIDNDTSTYSW